MRSLKMKLALSATLAASLLPTQAWAQSSQPFAQQNPTGQIGVYNPQRPATPTYSPYNNLTRPGGAASNYFGVIRPQMDSMRSFQQIQQSQSGFGAAPADETLYPSGPQSSQDTGTRLQTGHAVSYFNTMHYFPQSGGSSRSGGGAAGSYGNSGIPGRGTVGGNQPFFSGTNATSNGGNGPIVTP